MPIYKPRSSQAFKPKITGVAHCFTGDSVQLKAWLDLGLYIGITGWLCDERRGDVLRHALQYIPLDRLLLETDAPYLLPRNLTPKPASRCNEPAFLVHIANTVATLRQLELSDIARITVANSKELFKLNNPAGSSGIIAVDWPAVFFRCRLVGAALAGIVGYKMLVRCGMRLQNGNPTA